MRPDFVLALLGAVFIGACGGSGTGEGLPPQQGAQLARVALTMAPETSSEVDGVVITFTEASLVPEDGGDDVVLFESTTGQEVDLSALDENELLFSVSDGVPSGTYAKLRVTVDDVSIARGACADLETVVPDGELELVFDEPVDLSPGDRIVLRLAMDAAKSVQVTVDGTDGTCTVRPVLDVTVTDPDEEPTCPTTVTGTVERLLLNLDLAVVGFVLDLGADRGSQTVLLDRDSAIFGARGLPTGRDPIALGETLTAKGLIDGEGDLAGRVVAVGKLATLRGTIVRRREGPAFLLEPAPDGPIVGDTAVSLFPGTWILLDCDPADPRVLVEGATVGVLGKILVGESEVRAASVQVDASVLVGALRGIEAVDGGWDITVRPAGTARDRTVFVPDATGFLLEGDGAIPPRLLIDLLDCGARRVRVVLDTDAEAAGDTAREVRVHAADLRGLAGDLNVSTRTFVVGDTRVGLQRGATILELRRGQRTARLADLARGDRVRVFGLEACPGDAVDFHGFVLLILPPERDDPVVRRDEGCGLGFWKNHPEDWPARLTPRTRFADVFDSDAFGARATLGDVLRRGGGGIDALGRHAVAALLNAASPRVDYPLTVAEVVDAFADAHRGRGRGRGLESTKDRLERLNEEYCPLGG